MTDAEYLGDGVYLANDEWQLWLATGFDDNHVVALSPGVFLQLCERGAARLKAMGVLGEEDK